MGPLVVSSSPGEKNTPDCSAKRKELNTHESFFTPNLNYSPHGAGRMAQQLRMPSVLPQTKHGS